MKDLYLALQKFQELCPIFVKDTAGYGYKYNSLPDIVKVINPILKECGLLFHQRSLSTDTTVGVESRVVHIESGKELVSSLTMPLVELKSMNLYQAAGSAITYIRRYDMSNLLGLQSEKDDDGGGGKETVKPAATQVFTPKIKAIKEVAAKTLPVLDRASPKWNTAMEFVANNGDIQAIKNSYSISESDLILLENVRKLASI